MHRTCTQETIDALNTVPKHEIELARYNSVIRCTISDAFRLKPMSAERENVLRSWLNLPPLRIHHIETAAPKDIRRCYRPRVHDVKLAIDAHDIFGSVENALRWAVENYGH